MIATSQQPEIKLTDEQLAAVERLANVKDQITMGGWAGTGKSTVIRELTHRLPDFAVCAYTGKAANVLRRKGVDASTIHLLIYHSYDVGWCFGPEGRPENYEGDPEQDFPLCTERCEHCEVQEVKFKLRNRLDRWDEAEEKYIEPWSGVIVDESSMVDGNCYDDLKSFGVPLIFIGDHGQLPPVGTAFNLMEHPDVVLETIHRNAGEIAHFAGYLRAGGDIQSWFNNPYCTGKQVKIGRIEDLNGSEDQIICAFNSTRVVLNRLYRELLGRLVNHPAIGDRVMCLQNHRGYGVYNGQQGVISSLGKDRWGIDWMNFLVDGENCTVKVPYMPEQFHRPKKPEVRDFRKRLPFDYAYCVTCHRSQGDEWDKVAVIEEQCWGWDHRRWAYTAASRAKKQLLWIPEE